MASFIGEWIGTWIDTGISLVIAAIFVGFYFNAKVPRLYRKKWVLLAAAVLTLYGAINLGQGYHKYLEQLVPTKTEIQEDLSAENTLAVQDFVFRSPQGLALLIPKGYTYTTKFASGPFCLIALKDQSGISVGRLKCSDDLDKSVQDACSHLQRKNSTYSFFNDTALRVGKFPARRLSIEAVKGNVQIQGFVVMVKTDRELWEIMIACPKSSFQSLRNEYERVIESISIE